MWQTQWRALSILEHRPLHPLSPSGPARLPAAFPHHRTAYRVAAREKGIFMLEDFKQEIQKERSGSFDNEKSMGFINR